MADWERDLLQKNFPQAVLTKDKLTPETAEKYNQTEVVSCFIYSQLTEEVIDKLPSLKFIATRSTGFDHIDVGYAKTKKILISNVPEYGSRTVAEHTFALILTLTRKIYQSITQIKNLDFNHKSIRGIDLFGKTIGIVGLGKIGVEVLKIARGFDMRVLVFTRTKKKELAKELGFQYVDLNFLLANSDIVTLHLPYTKETHHFINKKNITHFKKGGFLINTARGGLIETEAILLGLKKKILAGVGLDVLEGEEELTEEIEILTSSYQKKADLKTLVLNHVLVNHPRVIVTPHNAFNTREALERILLTTIENINGFLKNKPKNLVGF